MGRYRLRTELRGVLPGFLAPLVPKGPDCGDHEWYRSDERTDRCYHCFAGVRPHVDGPIVVDAEFVEVHGSRSPRLRPSRLKSERF